MRGCYVSSGAQRKRRASRHPNGVKPKPEIGGRRLQLKIPAMVSHHVETIVRFGYRRNGSSSMFEKQR